MKNPKPTNLIIRNIIIFLIGIATTQSQVSGQEVVGQSKERIVYIQLKPAFFVPIALGDNFLNTAYDLNSGFMGEARVFFPGNTFIGLQGSIFKANIQDINLVGVFDSSTISHHYLTGGYSFIKRESKIGFDAGMGLGYGYCANRKQSSRFKDDGFSFMINLNINYRAFKVVGFHAGIQFAKDLLAIDTAPEFEEFFKNANLLSLSAGVQFYINQ